jgi:excisionase family DNA binding protein
MAMLREIMTPEQVADYLQLNKDTVYRYIREGKIAASRLGRSYRIMKSEIDMFLMATSTGKVAREALFKLVEVPADRNRQITPDEVEKDVAAALAEVRGMGH